MRIIDAFGDRFLLKTYSSMVKKWVTPKRVYEALEGIIWGSILEYFSIWEENETGWGRDVLENEDRVSPQYCYWVSCDVRSRKMSEKSYQG
jgi:hypothetical protein